MDNILIYLLKVAAGIALFYLTYLVFYRKETFYLRNRIILIFSIILPVIIPLLKIPVTVIQTVTAETSNAIADIPGNDIVPAVSQPLVASSAPLDFVLIIGWIYLSGVLIFLIRILISLISTYRIISAGVTVSERFPRIVVSDCQHPPFSFFPYAVIPSEVYNSGNYTDILDHESAHLRQGHTFDLLLSEIFIAFQWFNPFAWLIKRSVVLNHEYLADKVSVINRSIKDYQYRLLNIAGEVKAVSLAHTFNSLIKNRIIMINTKPSNRKAVWKTLIVLPAVLILSYAFVKPEYKYVATVNEPLTIHEAPSILREERIINRIQNEEKPPTTQKVSYIVQKEIKGYVIHNDGKPLSGASIIISGTTLSTFSDEKGFFKLIELPDDFLIVVSKTGFRTKIIEPVFNAEMVVKMVKDTIYENKLASNYSLTSAVSTGTKYSGSISTGPPPPPPIPTDANGNILEPSFPERYLKIRSEGLESPLYIKDGIVTDITLNKIDPATVESITVIKGEAALLKYGEKARDGAIEIKTRKDIYGGQVEKPVYIEVSKSPREPIENIPFVVVEKMPEFPGGNEAMLSWIANNIIYPDLARQQKIEGKVTVRFVVSSEGNVGEVVVLKTDNQILNEEAVRVVNSMPLWKPGSQNGKKVDVYSMVPVEFKLK